jgi:polyhydroxybutyrate depolymerase
MTPLRRLAAALLATTTALGVAGCGLRPGPADPADPASGTAVRVLEVDGLDRGYLLHVPADLADDPALVVMLHGGGGSGRQAERAYGWTDLADAHGFLVAYPDGVSRTWNAGDCCGPAARDDVDDVAFVTELVATLQEEFAVSPERTFATGMSNGAMMAYRMACETDLFAAIAPVAGTIVTACDDPTPTSVLHVHGLDDAMVRMDGELGAGPGRVDGMPVHDAIDVWLAAGTCSDPTTTADGAVTTIASTCADDHAVVLVTVAGAGHQWPGSVPREGAADPPSDALDASALIREFFAAA